MASVFSGLGKFRSKITTSPAQLQQVRHYARKKEMGDPKIDAIKRVMYPSNVRKRPTPTGGWRRDVGRTVRHAIPSVQAHETIERAWLLHKRHVRKARDTELSRKFECMKKAMQELFRVDSHLYYEANKPEDPRARSKAELETLKGMKVSDAKAFDARIRGLFPREMKLPSDTPPRGGWNYDFKPFHRPI
jgi:large subunit ribosomal protein L40